MRHKEKKFTAETQRTQRKKILKNKPLRSLRLCGEKNVSLLE
jgi:hypothetical protein